MRTTLDETISAFIYMVLAIYYPEVGNENADGRICAHRFDNLYSSVNTHAVQEELQALCLALQRSVVLFRAIEENGVFAQTEGQLTVVIEIGQNVFESDTLYESLVHAIPLFLQSIAQHSSSDEEDHHNAPVP